MTKEQWDVVIETIAKTARDAHLKSHPLLQDPDLVPDRYMSWDNEKEQIKEAWRAKAREFISETSPQFKEQYNA